MKRTLKASLAAAVLIGAGSVLVGMNRTTDLEVTSEAGTVETASVTRLYEIDPTHTNVIFKIRHGSVSNFYGRFNDTQGTIQFDKNNFEKSSMELTVQISSIDTNSRTRDGHLKGADFFNVRQYGEATFTSTSMTDDGDGEYTVTGEFTLQGKTVTLDAQLIDVREGKFNDFDVIGVEARFTIKRSDFGITKYLNTRNPNRGPLGDEVEIIVAIEAVGK
ncbi:polyisoprenoid-binding protein [bacterium]|nr:MAG: polyisoprenoid-binding protein [bacterium]